MDQGMTRRGMLRAGAGAAAVAGGTALTAPAVHA